jgi:hypothetical protein
MDKFKNLTIDEKINQMKEDYNSEWWRPSKIDNFDIKNKVISSNLIMKIFIILFPSYLE